MMKSQREFAYTQKNKTKIMLIKQIMDLFMTGKITEQFPGRFTTS